MGRGKCFASSNFIFWTQPCGVLTSSGWYPTSQGAPVVPIIDPKIHSKFQINSIIQTNVINDLLFLFFSTRMYWNFWGLFGNIWNIALSNRFCRCQIMSGSWDISDQSLFQVWEITVKIFNIFCTLGTNVGCWYISRTRHDLDKWFYRVEDDFELI